MGLSNGKVFYYMKRNMDSRKIVERGKDADIEAVNLADKPSEGHKVSSVSIIITGQTFFMCLRVKFES